ncbi:hypothetical protein FA13DRAFT_1734486 [Coprinellus micaceus]|uniref:BTB domain-containing protein n=1 Tax=Coprinellus micaceus TaxID=71717 RepID=A0A4Y7T804_COPMI|nr:hypothetical protein FA13DRAFT_1734486 [Coprinellus micaceus]
MVPIHGFVQFSEAFEAMFSMPQPEGSTEGRTIEFETLLDVLYPLAPRIQQVPLWKEQWLAVFRLANMWSMDKIRQLAVGEVLKIRSMDPVELVVMGRAHQILQWTLNGYIKIVEKWSQSERIPFEISDTLGFDTYTRLSELSTYVPARDGCRATRAPPSKSLTKAVKRASKDELAYMH